MPRKTIHELLREPNTTPVIESRKNSRRWSHSLFLSMMPQDQRKGIPGEICACAIAKAAERSFGGAAAIFPGGACYFKLIDHQGRPVILKMKASKETIRRVRDFDKSKGKIFPEGLLEFVPLPDSHLASARREMKSSGGSHVGPRTGLKYTRKGKARKAAPAWLRKSPRITSTAARITP